MARRWHELLPPQWRAGRTSPLLLLLPRFNPTLLASTLPCLLARLLARLIVRLQVKVMPIPGLMKTEKAVAHMADGLARDKAVTTMPMIPLIMISLVHAVPLAVTDILMRNNFLRSPFWGYVANDNEISKTPCIAAAPLATAVLPPAVEGTTAAGAAGGAASGAGAVVDHGAASGDEAASGSGGVRHRKRSASQSRA